MWISRRRFEEMERRLRKVEDCLAFNVLTSLAEIEGRMNQPQIPTLAPKKEDPMIGPCYVRPSGDTLAPKKGD